MASSALLGVIQDGRALCVPGSYSQQPGLQLHVPGLLQARNCLRLGLGRASVKIVSKLCVRCPTHPELFFSTQDVLDKHTLRPCSSRCRVHPLGCHGKPRQGVTSQQVQHRCIFVVAANSATQ